MGRTGVGASAAGGRRQAGGTGARQAGVRGVGARARQASTRAAGERQQAWALAERAGQGWLGGLGAWVGQGLCTRCTQPVFGPV